MPRFMLSQQGYERNGCLSLRARKHRLNGIAFAESIWLVI